jgi:hypothetical protein
VEEEDVHAVLSQFKAFKKAHSMDGILGQLFDLSAIYK